MRQVCVKGASLERCADSVVQRRLFETVVDIVRLDLVLVYVSAVGGMVVAAATWQCLVTDWSVLFQL